MESSTKNTVENLWVSASAKGLTEAIKTILGDGSVSHMRIETDSHQVTYLFLSKEGGGHNLTEITQPLKAAGIAKLLVNSIVHKPAHILQAKKGWRIGKTVCFGERIAVVAELVWIL